jgi:hypothetical protein
LDYFKYCFRITFTINVPYRMAGKRCSHFYPAGIFLTLLIKIRWHAKVSFNT